MKVTFHKKIFSYLEPMWTGKDGKISLRAVAAIALLIDLISNTHTSFYKWDGTRSMADAALVLGGEAALILALLGLTAYTNLADKKIDAGYLDTVNIKNAEAVNVDKKPNLDNPAERTDS